MTFEIKKQFTIDASTDRVWDILVDQFDDVADWATGVTRSVPHPETTVYPDGTSGGRVCEVIGFGATDERLVHYDRERREFGYSVDAEKIPGFVQNLTNHWRLTAVGTSTRVDMHVTADISGPLGSIIKPMMRRRFEKVLVQIEADLVSYAETGRVSVVKSDELASRAAA